MQLRLDFEGHGWLTLMLTHGPQRVELVGGYLLDTPADLLEAVLRLLRDGQEERVVFDQEPDLWLLRMRKLPGELLRIEVHFLEEVDPPAEELGEPLFRHTERAERFAAMLYAEYERLVGQGLEEDYGKIWGMYPFPRPALDLLAHVLRERSVIPG